MQRFWNSVCPGTVVALFFIIVAVFFFSAMVASAADVRLAWDHNDPLPEGYRIFVRDVGADYDYANPVWQGVENTGLVSDLIAGQEYAFIVRAFSGDLESPDSDEVVYTPPELQKQIVYPAKPKSILITFE